MRSGKTVSLIVLLVTGITFFWLRAWRSQPTLHPPVAPRSVATAPKNATVETPAERAIRAAESAIAARPQASSGYTDLATAYMRKSRESGDAGYYGRAEAAVRKALSLESDSVVALRTLAWVQTGKHEFRAALATAEQLLKRQPNDPLVYGLLGDAAIELGEYQRAEEAFQKMLDLRPGLASYSRAAYLLELYGDMDEAIAFMERAVQAGGAQDPEPLAWCLVQLGQLYFNRGSLGKAETAYLNALTLLPQYSLALAGLGRVRGAQQRYVEAIALYQQAVASVPAPDFIAALGDLFLLSGKIAEAERQYALVEYIERVNQTNQTDYNRQLALFYADHERKLDEALALAEAELTQRQDIYSYDVVAWVYYKKGRFAEAQKMMTQALRLGTQDARLLFHAGMIAQGLGQLEEARTRLRGALEINPYFSLRDAETARRTLAQLEQSIVAREGTHAR